METDTLDTRSLLERARSGDTEAFCSLCQIHEARLLRQAMTLCGNSTLAEDLAQDTLVEAWKCLKRYNGRCQFFTWLYAILLNRHRNALRQQRGAPELPFPPCGCEPTQSALVQLPDHAPAPDEAALRSEQAALIRQCINSLPQKHQDVILLRFFLDDSLEGIASALGCSVGTVKSRLFHALEKLRAMNALNAHSANFKTTS
jgi:RNA polymerase sigma-70 factor (ECF subfamily)